VVYDGPSANLTPSLLRDLYGAAAEELLTDTESAQRDVAKQVERAVDRAAARPEGASGRSAAFASAPAASS
jgi:phosphonate transport system ATP-binding protein